MQLSNLRGLTTGIALLALCALAVAYAARVPAPAATSQPPGVFSAERAMRHVHSIAERPHPTGSHDHERIRIYLLNELMVLGLTPRVQEATGVGTRHAAAGRVRNVLVRVPGKRPGGLAVLLMAHYDGVPAGPAAADDASGCAVLLETLRALRFSPQLEHDVIALFADGEEPGLLGAAAFVREHPWAKDVGVTLNFEARGTHGPSLMFETGAGNLDAVRVLRSVRGVKATSLSTAVYRRLPNDTDLSELMLLDTPALNFAFIGGVERYHTSEDDVAHLDRASVQHHGNQALALARAFGNGPLPRPKTSDAVFFDVPVLGLIVYPEAWAVPIAIVALGLVIVAIARLRKRVPRWLRDLSIGAAGLVVAVIVAGLLGFATASALQRLHGSLSGGGSPEWSGTYAVAVALTSFAVAALCYVILRRWATPSGLHLGVMLVWAILSLALAWSVPGMSFLFVWPALFVATATFVAGLRPRLEVAALWMSTIVVIVVLVPTVYLTVCTALGLDQTGAIVLSVFTALAALLLAPQLESLSRGAARPWVPAIAAAAALVLFAIGAFTVRTDPAHPTGAGLVYAVDGDSGKAWLTGYATSESARVWLTRTLNAGSPPADSGALPRWLTRNFDARRTVSAPMPEWLPSLSATLLSDSSSAGVRHVTMRIRPDRGMRVISIATEAEVLAAAVDGRQIDRSRYRARSNRWTLAYVAPPDSGFTLALTIRHTPQATFGLMGRLDVIPALEDSRLPRRPPGTLPVHDGDMSLIYRRLHL